MHKTYLYNTLIQHVYQSQIQHKVHTTHLYNTQIHKSNVRKMLASSETCFAFSFPKAENKKLKNTISYNTENTTRIQHAIYTTQKIQPNVGVWGAGLQ